MKGATSLQLAAHHGAKKDPIDDCVHCGFCLPACPTYVSWAEEMDSPRGRIYLMKGLRDGDISWDDTVASHFDRCLGCMACVTACPSGVRYDVLIENAREEQRAAVPRRFGDAVFRGAVFALFPYAMRLRVLALLLWVFDVVGLRRWLRETGWLSKFAPRLARLDALAPERSPQELVRVLPSRVAARGEQRLCVGLVTGCVQSVFFPEVNEATLRVLGSEGCACVAPEGQGCCGALSLHSGRQDEAKAFARALIRSFDDAEVDVIVVNSAGCGSSIKEYARLFEDDEEWRERARIFSSKVRDVCELVSELPPRAVRHPIEGRVAYHDACHLAHAQKLRLPPRRLLEGIPGLLVCEIPNGDQCCGSAGTYNLFEPESADEIGMRKVESVIRTGADVLVSANPGCTLHLQRLMRSRNVRVRAMHPIEVIDKSIRGEEL
jgi:glycolate oxidase iron-sulfur subunit